MAVLEGLHSLSRSLYVHRLTPLASLISGFIHFAFGAKLPPSAEIGRGTYFSSGGIGTVVHRRAKIGKDCVISSCVSIGSRRDYEGAPVIEDGCFIGAGARILGPVRVGSGSVIGANAVVVDDIPPGSVAVGVPARVIRSDISAEDYARTTGG